MGPDILPVFKALAEQNNQKNEDIRVQNQRIYTRTEIGRVFYRRVIILIESPQIRQDSPLKSSVMISNILTQKKLKLEEEYSLQADFESKYIVKNLAKNCSGSMYVWLQEDYDHLLSDFPLHNLNLQERFQIFDDVVQGVRDIHSLLICHRKLHLKTIVLASIGNGKYVAKINNFEQGRVLNNFKQTIDEPVNEPNEFSSPEIANSKPHGLATDIWSLGCLLNLLLYETLENIWVMKNHVEIEVPHGTPDWLLEMLRSMLHYDAKKRHSITNILDILKACKNCLPIMEKYVKLGKNDLKLKRRGSICQWERNESSP